MHRFLVASLAALPLAAVPVVAFAQPAGTQAPPPPSGVGATVDADAGAPSSGAAGGSGTAPAPPADPAAPPLDVTGTAGARAAGMAPPGTKSGDFMDTRLTWTFGDDDFLHKTGELVPISPTFSVGDRPQYRLFFDGLNSRFAGRENLTHLVMYKQMPSFIEGLTTEAALVLRFDLGQLASNNGNLNTALYDSGSYIRLFYHTGGSDKTGFSAVFFPLDTDRMRVGYLYDITWGGTAASINQSIFPRLVGSSPGMKMQFDADKFYGFVGFKTAQIVQPQQVLSSGTTDVETVRVGETNYGALLGGGVDALENLRFDASGGYFQQGKFDLEDVRGKPIYTYGASGRVVVHHNMPVPQSVDFLLYKNDPQKPMIIFKPEKYDAGEVAWSISAEGSLLQQHLKDFDASGSIKDQAATAGAVQGVVKAGYLRVSATGIYRNLNFVVRNVPGFIPFNTLPGAAKTDPELFGALAVDYHIAALKLTPGIGGGLQLPATFRGEFEEGGVAASRTVVVRAQGDESILPLSKGRQAIIQARASVRWNLSDLLTWVVWGQLVNDNNATLVVRDPIEGSASLRVYQSPTRFGVGTAIQARF